MSNISGFYHLQGILPELQQQAIVEVCREVYSHSPMFTPVMPSGQKFNCQMTSCGEYGWISDKNGYRYSKTHPSGQRWHPIPSPIKEITTKLLGTEYDPQSCLINYYCESGRLGLHQDNSEKNLTAPILSISLGDDAVFIIGGLKRSDPIEKIILKSGDVVIMSNEARLIYHGVKKIVSGTSNLLRKGGRLNLTIRQVF